MKRRRVKITGIGPVTPAGIGREAFWKGILEPVSRVRPFHGLGKQNGPLVAAHMDYFDITHFMERGQVPKGAARHTQFALAGAILALQDAGISKEEFGAANSTIVTGSTLFDFGGIGRAIEAVYQHGHRGAKGRVVYTTNTASVPGAINEVLGVTSDTMTLQSSCASGFDAIGYAAERIASGHANIALCGGADAPLHRFPLLELRAAGLTPPTEEMPERLARPFDMWRTTGVVSEGSCIFVLESDDSPRPGYSFISGYAFANDEPDDLCGGLVASSARAMAEARLRPTEIEVVSAWGPGHRLIDAGEARAMKGVFRSKLPEIPFVSIKGSIGSPLGAAGPMQVAAAALGQRHGVIPPTVNWDDPDPACPLNLSHRERLVSHEISLINTHGLAGVNSSMIIERC